MKFEQFSELWDKHVENNTKIHYLPNPDVMSENTKTALIAYANGDTSHIDKIKEHIKERKNEVGNLTGKIDKCFEPMTAEDVFNIWSKSCHWSSVAYEHNFDNLHPHIKSKWECLAVEINKRIENARNEH